MIVVADSGSTKCDWALINGTDRLAEFSTIGFNPFYHDEAFIVNALKQEKVLIGQAAKVTQVHFYGAGCSSEERNRTVRDALRQIFVNADVQVNHDVLGAAIAACQGREGVACILGTGSNSCYYDGTEVSEVLPSLGYILGDEGSGAWFGKRLLTDHLYHRQLPDPLKNELIEKGHTKASILENIYMKPHANVYLASFMRIIGHHGETEYVKQLVSSGLREFLLLHVCCYPNHREVETGFVGSVAFHFQDVLKVECEKLGIRLGRVVQKPIDGLIAFHSA